MAADIYSMRPINKTAALVTNQSGCSATDELDGHQIRENLKLKIKALEVRILALPKGPERRQLGLEKAEIARQMVEAAPRRKAPEIASYFVEAAKENMTWHEFDRTMRRAAELKKSWEDSQAGLTPPTD